MAGDKQKVTEGISIQQTPAQPPTPDIHRCGVVWNGVLCTLLVGHLPAPHSWATEPTPHSGGPT